VHDGRAESDPNNCVLLIEGKVQERSHEYTRIWCESKIEEMEKNIFVNGPVVTLDKCPYMK